MRGSREPRIVLYTLYCTNNYLFLSSNILNIVKTFLLTFVFFCFILLSMSYYRAFCWETSYDVLAMKEGIENVNTHTQPLSSIVDGPSTTEDVKYTTTQPYTSSVVHGPPMIDDINDGFVPDLVPSSVEGLAVLRKSDRIPFSPLDPAAYDN